MVGEQDAAGGGVTSPRESGLDTSNGLELVRQIMECLEKDPGRRRSSSSTAETQGGHALGRKEVSGRVIAEGAIPVDNLRHARLEPAGNEHIEHTGRLRGPVLEIVRYASRDAEKAPAVASTWRSPTKERHRAFDHIEQLLVGLMRDGHRAPASPDPPARSRREYRSAISSPSARKTLRIGPHSY